MCTQEENYNVRVALEIDTLKLISIGKRYVEEATRWGKLKFDPSRAMRFGLIAIEDPNQQIFVATKGKDVVGFLWVAVVGQVWTSEPIAQDLFLYVEKGHRNATVGNKLISAFEQWVRDLGVNVITTGANSGILEDTPACKLYESLGYQKAGMNFYKQLKED